MTEYQDRLPPLGALVHFEAAHRHRNFTRAAEELHFSQASVSRRVGELEASLGVRLFERHRHDVTPTSEGDALASVVRQALGELSAAADLLRRRGNADTSFTIVSDLSLATNLLAPVLGDFQRDHPELAIRVVSSYEPIETAGEEFDIGLQYWRGGPSRYHVEPVADDAVVAVCSPSLAPDSSAPVTPAALAELPLLHVDYGHPDWPRWSEFLAFLGLEHGPSADGMTFTSYQMAVSMAERGEGVALGWLRSASALIEAGRLVPIIDTVMPLPDAIVAYRSHRLGGNDHADEFLSRLRSAARGAPDV